MTEEISLTPEQRAQLRNLLRYGGGVSVDEIREVLFPDIAALHRKAVEWSVAKRLASEGKREDPGPRPAELGDPDDVSRRWTAIYHRLDDYLMAEVAEGRIKRRRHRLRPECSYMAIDADDDQFG